MRALRPSHACSGRLQASAPSAANLSKNWGDDRDRSLTVFIDATELGTVAEIALKLVHLVCDGRRRSRPAHIRRQRRIQVTQPCASYLRSRARGAKRTRTDERGRGVIRARRR
jgi:hypothetical protein